MMIRWDSPTQYMMHRGKEHSLKPALGNLRHEEVSEYGTASGSPQKVIRDHGRLAGGGGGSGAAGKDEAGYERWSSSIRS